MPYGIIVQDVSCLSVELTVDSEDLGVALFEAINIATLIGLYQTVLRIVFAESGGEIEVVNISS